MPFSLDEEKSRLERLALISSVAHPYQNRLERTHTCREVLRDFPKLQESKTPVWIVGRVMTIRKHGSSIFLDVKDATGVIQVYCKKNVLQEERFSFLNHLVDRGDFLSIRGIPFLTKKGQPTLEVDEFRFLTKTLLPLPEKWHGLADVELRFRERYLDLIMNDEAMDRLRKRSRIVEHIHRFFQQHKFTAVETPILQSIAGGATARPFITHHQALDRDLYLRIAPELYLKRLLVGGFEKVYEIARCFRNEGVDHNHNPEFTQVEWYEAYSTYEKLMDFTERLLADVVTNVLGSREFRYKDRTIDFSPPFPRFTFRKALQQFADIDIEDYSDAKSLAPHVAARGVVLTGKEGRGKLMDELFKKCVRPRCIRPTFIIDHPIELSPLARQHVDMPSYVERFQILVAGEIELCNGFSELNDPLEQEKRFAYQESLRERGDDEAQRMDRDFVTALKYGMPPAAGCGLGIDRLAALLTNAPNLKEVIAFPTLKNIVSAK